MHGSYRLSETRDGVHVYARSTDLDALIANFPALSFVDPDPRSRREKWAMAGLGASASVLLLALGGSSQVELETTPAMPTRDTGSGTVVTPAPSTASPVPMPDGPAISIEQSPLGEPTVRNRTEPVDPLTPGPLPVTTKTVDAATERPSPAVESSIIEPAAPTQPGLLLTEEHELSEADSLLAAPMAATTNQGGKTHLSARIDGEIAGQLSFSDSGQTVKLQLGSVLALLADRFSPADYERLANSPAAAEYVAIDTLAAAGLAVSYDPVYDEILLDTTASASPQDAQPQIPSEYS